MFCSANLEETQEKTFIFGLSRLGSNSMRKSSSHSQRPSTPKSPIKPSLDFGSDILLKQEKIRPVKERESAVLRKRPLSTVISGDGVTAPVTVAAAVKGANVGSVTSSGLVKPGQSILDQIGEPDHVGWMRKRGDRYNSWKSRYFVLKGPHMYCLKSDSKAVSQSPYSCPASAFYSVFKIDGTYVGNEDQGVHPYHRI